MTRASAATRQDPRKTDSIEVATVRLREAYEAVRAATVELLDGVARGLHSGSTEDWYHVCIQDLVDTIGKLAKILEDHLDDGESGQTIRDLLISVLTSFLRINDLMWDRWQESARDDQEAMDSLFVEATTALQKINWGLKPVDTGIGADEVVVCGEVVVKADRMRDEAFRRAWLRGYLSMEDACALAEQGFDIVGRLSEAGNHSRDSTATKIPDTDIKSLISNKQIGRPELWSIMLPKRPIPDRLPDDVSGVYHDEVDAVIEKVLDLSIKTKDLPSVLGMAETRLNAVMRDILGKEDGR